MIVPAPEREEWLIRKGGYFYRPNCRGYTTSKFEAGRYTKAKAEAEASVEPWHMKAVHQDEWPDDPPSVTIKELVAALSECQSALASMIAPDAIKQTTVINAFEQATRAEAKARAALDRAEGRHP